RSLWSLALSLSVSRSLWSLALCLSLSRSLALCLSLSLSRSLSLALCLSLSLSGSRSLALALSVSSSLCLSLSGSRSLALALSVSRSLSVSLSLALSVCRSLFLSLSLSVCRSLSLSVALSLCLSLSRSLSLALSLALSLSLCVGRSRSLSLSLSPFLFLSLSRSLCHALTRSVCVSVCMCVCWQVMWTPDWDRGQVRQVAPGLQQMSVEKLPPQVLHQQGISRLLLRYSQASPDDIREFSRSNVSVTLYTVNEPWLFSVLWCSGVSSVSSEAPNILRKVPYPIWLMSPDEYCLIWVAADLISFTVVIGIFVFQKWRLSGMHSYNPEQIMLSAAVRRSSRDLNIMKEKLIFSGQPQ
uniref:GP-PDE domain-containing protein n=1 Tax=Oncorhynchus tshawytscha TaxID=74940 RepID=A0AAZ3RUU0_ONCTS